jgi:hypothetical protein
MLPPVTATSSSDLPFNNMPAHQAIADVAAASAKQTPANATTTAASLFARANLASLSSELQFAQNISVLADAIGKLLKMPKQDGETASVYVQRLTTTMATLAPAQRTALEAQIAKVLPGLNLSILIETLKNPTGPQAAHLALLLETAPHKGRDLAANAVVSSYRQNVGAESGSKPRDPAQIPAGRPINQTMQGPLQEVRQGASNAAAFQSISGKAAAEVRAPQIIVAGSEQRPAISSSTAKVANVVRTVASQLDLRPAERASSAAPAAAAVNRLDASAVPARAPASALPQAPQTTQPNIVADLAKQLPYVGDRPAASAPLDAKPFQPAARILELRERFSAPMPIATEAEDEPVTKAKASPAPAQQAVPATMTNVAALIAAITSSKLPMPAESAPSLLASIFGFIKAGVSEKPLAGTQTTSALDPEVEELLQQIKTLPKAEAQAKLFEALRQLPADSAQVQAMLMSALRNELTAAQPYVNYSPAEDDYEESYHSRGKYGAGSDEADAEHDADAQDEEPEEYTEQETELDVEPEYADPITQSDELLAESYYLKMGTFN